MPIDHHRATGWGVFGLKRHVKSGLQEGVRTTAWCGLGLPARILRFSEHGKTADHAAAEPDNGADGNTSGNAPLFFNELAERRACAFPAAMIPT